MIGMRLWRRDCGVIDRDLVLKEARGKKTWEARLSRGSWLEDAVKGQSEQLNSRRWGRNSLLRGARLRSCGQLRLVKLCVRILFEIYISVLSSNLEEKRNGRKGEIPSLVKSAFSNPIKNPPSLSFAPNNSSSKILTLSTLTKIPITNHFL